MIFDNVFSVASQIVYFAETKNITDVTLCLSYFEHHTQKLINVQRRNVFLIQSL